MHKFKTQLVALVAVALASAGAGCDHSRTKAVAPQAEEQPEDMTVAYEVATDYAIREFKLKLKGSRGRIDKEEGVSSTICDPDLGCFFLDHVKRTYRKFEVKIPDMTDISPDDTASFAATLSDAFPKKFTGKTQKIGDWECEEFVICDSFDVTKLRQRGVRMVAWIAKDFPQGEAIQARIDKIAPPEFVAWVGSISSKDFTCPGFAARVEVRQSGRYPMVKTFTQISYGPLDAHDFEIPAGYREIEEQ